MGKKLGLDKNKINQAFNKSKQYSASMEGLAKAVKEHGGASKIDEALKKANNPIIKMGLKALGVDTDKIDKIGQEIKNMINSNNTPSNTDSNMPNQAIGTSFNNDANSMLEKLKNLR